MIVIIMKKRIETECGFVAIFSRDAEPQDIDPEVLHHRGPDFTRQARARVLCKALALKYHRFI